MAYDLRRYSTIFWVSSTTIEKLNQGFANILNLIGHADRDHPDQGTRLVAARRWLEESDALGWLLILDNINKDTVGFLREHLPRKNSKGNILFTTRTVFVAEALTNPTEEPRQSFELQGPCLKDAVNLLLKGSGASEMSSSVDRAEDVVKCLGCLPLAIAHAASFVKQSHKNMDELFELYKSDHKYEVGFDPVIPGFPQVANRTTGRYLAGRMTCWATRRNLSQSHFSSNSKNWSVDLLMQAAS